MQLNAAHSVPAPPEAAAAASLGTAVHESVVAATAVTAEFQALHERWHEKLGTTKAVPSVATESRHCRAAGLSTKRRPLPLSKSHIDSAACSSLRLLLADEEQREGVAVESLQHRRCIDGTAVA